jgi:hypothetical protein
LQKAKDVKGWSTKRKETKLYPPKRRETEQESEEKEITSPGPKSSGMPQVDNQHRSVKLKFGIKVKYWTTLHRDHHLENPRRITGKIRTLNPRIPHIVDGRWKYPGNPLHSRDFVLDYKCFQKCQRRNTENKRGYMNEVT